MDELCRLRGVELQIEVSGKSDNRAALIGQCDPTQPSHSSSVAVITAAMSPTGSTPQMPLRKDQKSIYQKRVKEESR